LVWERNCIFNGSKAELRAADFSGKLELRTYKPAKVHRKRIRYHGILHGGGDTDQLRDFAAAVRGGNPDRTILAVGESALESHLLALAAEEARRTKSVVNIDAFRQKAEQEATLLAQTASRD
jgi:predicted dehydrogenase